MKKQLLSITFVLFTHLIFSQSIPNGGFESWVTTDYQNPINYQTSNLNTENGVQVPINAVKVNDAYHGNYAIKLTTVLSGTNSTFAFFANGNPGSNPSGGIPISQKPTGLRFYYKSNIILGDTAIFLTIFKKAGVAIGTYIQKISTTHSSYTLFNTTFSPSLSLIPDTVIIGCASSNPFVGSGAMIGNSLQIDSLSFKGITTQPANLNGDFENWQTLTSYKLNGWSNNTNGFQRTTDAYTGAYALELQTSPPDFDNNNISMGFASTGIPTQSATIGGYPYYATSTVAPAYDSLYFNYKYLPGDPTDKGRIDILFKKNGLVTYGYSQQLGLSATYSLVGVGFTLTPIPDTMIVSFNSSSYAGSVIPSSYVGSDLKVDNLYLKSQKIPISNFIMPANGCVGQPLQLYDNSFNMPYAWGWIAPGATPGSSTSQNPVFVYNSTGTKTITMVANNQFGASATISKTISINAVPIVSATSTITACGGSNVILTANGASSYTWSSGQTTPTIAVNAIVTTNYTVTGTSSGCSNFGIASVIVPSGITPQICMVTTDSAGINNEIYWDKTLYSRVDSFIIYRETPTITNSLTGSYSRIGAVSKSALSMFIDTTRSVGGFINGNPNFTSYKYKLQIRDSCGVYSALSPYHQTIFVQDQQNGNFNWNPYTIEDNTVTPISNYVLTRRNLLTGITSTVAGTSSNLLSDPYYNVFYSANVKWFVDAQGFNCNPTMRLSGINALKTRTKSNSTNERAFPTIGIKENNFIFRNLNIYPNPTINKLNIDFGTNIENGQIELVDVSGRTLIKDSVSGSNYSIYTNNFANGIYFIYIYYKNNLAATKKIVVQR
ncbi:MAG: T9SS type A sorting domain-containing protein [Bacteroidota bacterium]|nr:T9SS type A sorting domain-containing protein [Bacteroidota bacterium]